MCHRVVQTHPGIYCTSSKHQEMTRTLAQLIRQAIVEGTIAVVEEVDAWSYPKRRHIFSQRRIINVENPSDAFKPVVNRFACLLDLDDINESLSGPSQLSSTDEFHGIAKDTWQMGTKPLSLSILKEVHMEPSDAECEQYEISGMQMDDEAVSACEVKHELDHACISAVSGIDEAVDVAFVAIAASGHPHEQDTQKAVDLELNAAMSLLDIKKIDDSLDHLDESFSPSICEALVGDESEDKQDNSRSMSSIDDDGLVWQVPGRYQTLRRKAASFTPLKSSFCNMNRFAALESLAFNEDPYTPANQSSFIDDASCGNNGDLLVSQDFSEKAPSNISLSSSWLQVEHFTTFCGTNFNRFEVLFLPNC